MLICVVFFALAAALIAGKEQNLERLERQPVNFMATCGLASLQASMDSKSRMEPRTGSRFLDGYRCVLPLPKP